MATSNPFTINTTLNLKPSQADLKKLQSEIQNALNTTAPEKFDKSMTNVAIKLKNASAQAEKLQQQVETLY